VTVNDISLQQTTTLNRSPLTR